MRFQLLAFFLLFTVSLAAVPVSSGAQGNPQTSGYTLDEDLLYRINFGSAEDVRVLLAKGANPNAKTHQGEIALNVAIDRADAESAGIAQALIDKGADLEVLDKSGNTPIINALRFKQEKIVMAMLAKGVNYHIRTPDGTSLVDYARQNADEDSAKAIQALLNNEIAAQQSLRTPERFREIAKAYTLDSCLFQYWSYILSSRQMPEKDAEVTKKVDDLKNTLYQQITQIQKYYTAGSLMTMHKVAAGGVQQIYDSLDSMISNSNRTENGVGKEEDAQRRCAKIMEKLPMDYVPVPLEVQIDQTPAAPVKAFTPPPVPMEPFDSNDSKSGTPSYR